jgi:hypothetical protein
VAQRDQCRTIVRAQASAERDTKVSSAIRLHAKLKASSVGKVRLRAPADSQQRQSCVRDRNPSSAATLAQVEVRADDMPVSEAVVGPARRGLRPHTDARRDLHPVNKVWHAGASIGQSCAPVNASKVTARDWSVWNKQDGTGQYFSRSIGDKEPWPLNRRHRSATSDWGGGKDINVWVDLFASLQYRIEAGASSQVWSNKKSQQVTEPFNMLGSDQTHVQQQSAPVGSDIQDGLGARFREGRQIDILASRVFDFESGEMLQELQSEISEHDATLPVSAHGSDASIDKWVALLSQMRFAGDAKSGHAERLSRVVSLKQLKCPTEASGGEQARLRPDIHRDREPAADLAALCSSAPETVEEMRALKKATYPLQEGVPVALTRSRFTMHVGFDSERLASDALDARLDGARVSVASGSGAAEGLDSAIDHKVGTHRTDGEAERCSGEAEVCADVDAGTIAKLLPAHHSESLAWEGGPALSNAATLPLNRLTATLANTERASSTCEEQHCKHRAGSELPVYRDGGRSSERWPLHHQTSSDRLQGSSGFQAWLSHLHGLHRCQSANQLQPAMLVSSLQALKNLRGSVTAEDDLTEAVEVLTVLISWAAAANSVKRPVMVDVLGTALNAHASLVAAVAASAEASSAVDTLLRAAAADPDTYTSSRSISQMCSGQYKLRRYCDKFWECVGQVDLCSLTGRTLGTLVYAAAVLPGQCDAPPPALHFWQACLRAMKQAAPQLDNHAVSNCLWAICTLHEVEGTAARRAHDSIVHDHNSAVDALVDAASHGAGSMNGLAVASCCWAIVGINRDLPMPLVHAVTQTASQMNPQCLSNSLSAIAKASPPPSRALDNACQALKTAAFKCVPHMNAQDISAMWWALARMGHQPRGILQRSLRRAVGSKAGDMSPKNLANVLWAMARMGVESVPQPAAIMRALIAVMPSMNSQDVANVVWGLGALPLKVHEGTRQALLKVTEEQADHLVPQEVLQVLQGVERLRWKVPPSCRATLCKAVHRVASKLSSEELRMVIRLLLFLEWRVPGVVQNELQHAVTASTSSDLVLEMCNALQRWKVHDVA